MFGIWHIRPTAEALLRERSGSLTAQVLLHLAGLAWAHSSLSAMFGDVPLTDVLILLVGLPLIAAADGSLLAGREPEGLQCRLVVRQRREDVVELSRQLGSCVGRFLP